MLLDILNIFNYNANYKIVKKTKKHFYIKDLQASNGDEDQYFKITKKAWYQKIKEYYINEFEPFDTKESKDYQKECIKAINNLLEGLNNDN